MGKKIAPEDKKLRGKQRAFIDYYMEKGFNATEAARSAGYKGSQGTLRSIGSENLTKPNIAKEIDRRFAERAMTGNEVLSRLGEMARGFDVTRYATTVETYTKGKDGNVYPSGFAVDIDMEQLQKDGYSHLVKRIYATKTGSIQVEMHDQKHALELIGKNKKLWTEKIELGGSLDLTGISDDGLIAGAAAIIDNRKKNPPKSN